MKISFKNHVRKNLFHEMSAEELLKYYRSYQKCLITGKTISVWKDIVDEYKEFVYCSGHPKAAEAVCEGDMFNEIANRYFGIVNMVLH